MMEDKIKELKDLRDGLLRQADSLDYAIRTLERMGSQDTPAPNRRAKRQVTAPPVMPTIPAPQPGGIRLDI